MVDRCLAAHDVQVVRADVIAATIIAPHDKEVRPLVGRSCGDDDGHQRCQHDSAVRLRVGSFPLMIRLLSFRDSGAVVLPGRAQRLSDSRVATVP